MACSGATGAGARSLKASKSSNCMAMIAPHSLSLAPIMNLLAGPRRMPARAEAGYNSRRDGIKAGADQVQADTELGKSVEPSDRIRVVLIDDNELTRTALRLALPSDTVEVVAEAATGRSGLDVCLKLKPDIVFLDVVMPDLGGLEILPAIMDALPMTEVLMVTASNDRLTIEKSIMGGAASFIIKPFSAGTVTEALKRALANQRHKRDLARQARQP